MYFSNAWARKSFRYAHGAGECQALAGGDDFISWSIMEATLLSNQDGGRIGFGSPIKVILRLFIKKAEKRFL